MKYCNACGDKVAQVIPDMDDRLRYVCNGCSIIHYQNPNVIVGCLPFYLDKILLCRRAIEPQKGLWTLPAGFMENGETSLAGAMRETVEEAGATLDGGQLYRIFDVPHINQVYMFYLSRLAEPTFLAGVESLEVGLFSEQDIPWGKLAFPVIYDVLKEYFEDRKVDSYPVRISLPSKQL